LVSNSRTVSVRPPVESNFKESENIDREDIGEPFEGRESRGWKSGADIWGACSSLFASRCSRALQLISNGAVRFCYHCPFCFLSLSLCVLPREISLVVLGRIELLNKIYIARTARRLFFRIEIAFLKRALSRIPGMLGSPLLSSLPLRFFLFLQTGNIGRCRFSSSTGLLPMHRSRAAIARDRLAPNSGWKHPRPTLFLDGQRKCRGLRLSVAEHNRRGKRKLASAR